MPVVPFTPNPETATRRAQAQYSSASGQPIPGMPPGSALSGTIPDPQFALMAAAQMHSEGRLVKKPNA